MQLPIRFHDQHSELLKMADTDANVLKMIETEINEYVTKVTVLYQYPYRKTQSDFYFCKNNGKYLRTYPISSLYRLKKKCECKE